MAAKMEVDCNLKKKMSQHFKFLSMFLIKVAEGEFWFTLPSIIHLIYSLGVIVAFSGQEYG